MDAEGQRRLAAEYRKERGRFFENEAALLQIVEEDFPADEAVDEVTRFHRDALRDLANRLAALVEGWRGPGG